MGRLSGLMSLGGLLTVTLLLTACDSQKQPAQAAYAQVEASVAPVRDNLEKYAPEDFERLNELMDQMKARLNSKDYQGALAIQPHVMSQLAAASTAAAQKRNALVSSLNLDWRKLAAIVPGMMSQVSARLSDLQAMSRLPASVTRDGVKRVRAGMTDLNADWNTALQASRRNDYAAAVTAAQSIKKRCQEFGVLLGAPFSETAL